jgi:hypothetical protein
MRPSGAYIGNNHREAFTSLGIKTKHSAAAMRAAGKDA